MTTEVRAKELTAAEALSRLAVFQETRDPCENGHVEHGREGHLGRRLVHSVSPRGFGADWDEDSARAFLRWIKFDTLPDAAVFCATCGHVRACHSSGGMCDGDGTECYCVRFPDAPDFAVLV